mmetsp:Transcript_68002/g.199026  ORF Transcript_68002/g.199026 Transcript_68002/m.199026 type:complete len:192 (+) Transcript_68002:143-718(+)
MFGFCCCNGDGQESETIQAISTTDEDYDTPPVLRPSPSCAPGARPGERERLEALASGFARQAVKGLRCAYVPEGGAQAVRTLYRVTKGLDSLVVVSPLDDDKALETCPLTDIQDVYTWMEDGSVPFQGEWIRKADAAGLDKELLVMIVYRAAAAAEGQARFCLLPSDRESRDTFLECLRLLCIYALNRQAR